MDENQTEEDFEKERKRLISFGNSALLGYIRTFSEIIMSQLDQANAQLVTSP